MAQDKDLFGTELPRLGAPPFREHWTNIKAAKIAYLAGQGLSAPAIAIEIEERDAEGIIARMLNYWGFTAHTPLPSYSRVPVPLAAKHRTMLAAEARRRDKEMPELCRMILTQVAQDELYAAVLEN